MIAVLKDTSIEWIIQQMHKEASKHNPPVFSAEKIKDPFKILVFTFLSARTKDETTIKVVNRLFSVAGSPEKIAKLPLQKIEKLLYGIGFYHVKSRNLLAISKTVAKHGVPDTFEELTELPGVGRKTANIVLARAFGKNTLGVDVHVHRISNRIGMVKTKKPEQTEVALLAYVPKKLIRKLNRNFVAFGQTVCLPRNPKCTDCPLNQVCRRINVTTRCENCKY